MERDSGAGDDGSSWIGDCARDFGAAVERAAVVFDLEVERAAACPGWLTTLPVRSSM